MNVSDLILSAEVWEAEEQAGYILCPGPFLFSSATEKTAGMGSRR